MPLRSYDEVRPFAPLIRQKVVSRVMPPWPIDMTVGIQKFKNDRSLTNEEIETIALWVDSGAQIGDPADMPAGLEWPDWSTAWRFERELGRPPDVVVSTPWSSPDLCVKAEEAPRLRLGCLGDLLFLEE